MAEATAREQLTVVFTDVEQSSTHWERMGNDFKSVLERHDAIIRECVERMGGSEVKSQGDGFMLVFPSVLDAVLFAGMAQKELTAESWPVRVGSLRVRIGMHSGCPLESRGPDGHTDYYGPIVNRAARVADAGHGGQVLLSTAAVAGVRDLLPPDYDLHSLGRHRLRGLDEPEEIFQLTHPSAPDERFPPLRTLDVFSHNLPVQLTTFVGRERELAQLAGLLGTPHPRLITIVGPGGVGKTRLALQAAADGARLATDGLWFIDLSEVTSSERVVQAIAAAVGLRGDDPDMDVKRYLQQRGVLLVLDSAERVTGLAVMLADLLRAGPRVKCLVTSRTVLHAAGEHVFELGALPLPELDSPAESLSGFDSVALLLERAHESGATVKLGEQTAAPLAELCCHLDGIPLAIELAATRLRHFAPAELLRRLDQRFELLVSRQPDLPKRQRTLRSVLEWSYDLLTPQLQALLAHLSVFRGTFSAEAVADVCAIDDPWTALADLSDQSLLHRQQSDSETRYLALETIREFAASQLSAEERVDLRKRHADVYLRRASQLNREAGGAGEAAALDRMESDLGNLRAGMAYCRDTNATLQIAGYAAALAYFMWRRGYWQELTEWSAAGRQALSALAAPPADLAANLLYANTAVALDRGDLALSEQTCEQGLRAAREAHDDGHEGLFLNLEGLIHRRAGRMAAARAALQRGLSVARSAGDRRTEGMALHNLALLAHDDGNLWEARRLYEDALPLRQAAGDTRGAAESSNNLGIIAESEMALEAAAEWFRQAIAAYLQLQDVQGLAVSLCNLGEVLTMRGMASQATQLLEAAARALAELGSVHCTAARQVCEQAHASAGTSTPPAVLPWRRSLLEAAQIAIS